MTEDIRKGQASYYGKLFEQHGPGVDAVASAKQTFKDLRYEKLAAILAPDDDVTVHEIGFGLAHFHEFVKQTMPTKKVRYSGSEVTPHFVDYCKERYPESQFFLRDIAEGTPKDRYDYVVFAGTFYHMAGSSSAEYFTYVKKMLENAFAMCERGMVVNFITGYVDYVKDDLFACDVKEMIDFTVKRLSRFFKIDHGYPLFEYTLSVYKEGYVKQRYPAEDFAKYFKGR
jgi:hypothetical protein